MSEYAHLIILQDGYDESYRSSMVRQWGKIVLSGPDTRLCRELLSTLGKSLQALAEADDWREITEVCDGINRRGIFNATSNHSKIVLEADRKQQKLLEAERDAYKENAQRIALQVAQERAEEQKKKKAYQRALEEADLNRRVRLRAELEAYEEQKRRDAAVLCLSCTWHNGALLEMCAPCAVGFEVYLQQNNLVEPLQADKDWLWQSIESGENYAALREYEKSKNLYGMMRALKAMPAMLPAGVLLVGLLSFLVTVVGMAVI